MRSRGPIRAALPLAAAIGSHEIRQRHFRCGANESHLNALSHNKLQTSSNFFHRSQASQPWDAGKVEKSHAGIQDLQDPLADLSSSFHLGRHLFCPPGFFFSLSGKSKKRTMQIRCEWDKDEEGGGGHIARAQDYRPVCLRWDSILYTVGASVSAFLLIQAGRVCSYGSLCRPASPRRAVPVPTLFPQRLLSPPQTEQGPCNLARLVPQSYSPSGPILVAQ